MLSLFDAQLELGKFIKFFESNDVGERSVEGQRNYLAGVIDALFIFQKISEQTRATLHACYFEGMDVEMAALFNDCPV